MKKMRWYNEEVVDIAAAEGITLKQAESILFLRIAKIADEMHLTLDEASLEYGGMLYRKHEFEFHVKHIMEEKGVSREVAEAEVAILL